MVVDSLEVYFYLKVVSFSPIKVILANSYIPIRVDNLNAVKGYEFLKTIGYTIGMCCNYSRLIL